MIAVVFMIPLALSFIFEDWVYGGVGGGSCPEEPPG